MTKTKVDPLALWYLIYCPYTAFSIVCVKQNVECVGVRELWCGLVQQEVQSTRFSQFFSDVFFHFDRHCFHLRVFSIAYSPLSGQRQHMRKVRKYRSNKYNESVWVMKQLRLIPSKGSLGEWGLFLLTVSSFMCSVKIQTFATAHPWYKSNK